jgi:hypothetical protein
MAVDCKIFGDGGGGGGIVFPKHWLLLPEIFLALLFAKKKLEKRGSRSKTNILVGTNGPDPLLICREPVHQIQFYKFSFTNSVIQI